MSRKVLIILSCLALVHFASAQNENVTTGRPSSTSVATPSTSTSTSTTISPETPSTPMPPMARKPDWSIKGPTGSCILLAGNLTFSLTYMTTAGSTATKEMPVPKTATASGSCTDFTNSLVLTWPGQTAGGMVNNVTFMFIKKPVYNAGNATGEGSYDLTTIFGRVNADFPDATPGQTFYISGKPTGILTSDLASSYKCVSAQSISADKTGSVQLTFEDVQAEAFHQGATDEFEKETICTKDTLGSILPIVGYVLTAVVVAGALAAFMYIKAKRAGYIQV